MKGSYRSWEIYKHKFVILKLAVSFLATALALRVFINHSTGLPPQTSPVLEPQPQSQPQADYSINKIVPEINVNVQAPHKEKCDPFTGEWIPNPAGPAYDETCNLIEGAQNCKKNERPDSGYLYWRWRPRNCELPQFDAQRFLEKMRNKTWALIGDSISRNHVQSLLCMLSKVEEAVYYFHDEGWKSRGWRFPSYNLTINVWWSPFLAETVFPEDSTREIEVHLDRLEKKWMEQYKNTDYMIFSTGKWFLKTTVYYENNKILGCHNCFKQNITELGFDYAYRKSLRNTLNFIATSGHKGLIIFRTSTPDHFEGGEWSSGGSCNRTAPFKEGEIEMKEVHRILRKIELEEFERAAAKASENGVNLKLLDLGQLTLLRPDGHPGPYIEFYPSAKDKTKVQRDCLHWCLPGPIDSWNDLIMHMVLNG